MPPTIEPADLLEQSGAHRAGACAQSASREKGTPRSWNFEASRAETVPMPARQDAGADISTNTAAAESIALASKKILFFDEYALVAGMGGQILTRLGYAVTVTTNQEKALEALLENSRGFDLLVTEISVLELLEIKRRATDIKGALNIPVILCYASCTANQMRLASKLGATAILCKPYDMKTLAVAVATALGPGEAVAVACRAYRDATLNIKQKKSVNGISAGLSTKHAAW